MRDLCLKGLTGLEELVVAENLRQLYKWGGYRDERIRISVNLYNIYYYCFRNSVYLYKDIISNSKKNKAKVSEDR